MPYVPASGVQVNFPFEPYECQVAYMEKVVDCLKEGVNGILESPTGTGKTLCLLCSSLAWLEGKKGQIASKRWNLAGANEVEGMSTELLQAKSTLADQLDAAAGNWAGESGAPKIIYASRTHSQLSQAINELKRTAYSHFKVCVLGSREQLCIHPQVSQEESNTAKVHMCRAKVSQRSCYFYNNVDATKHQYTKQILDIEDLVGIGQRHKCCPYYASRELKSEADIIFMPYNYLLDPKSRRAHGVELQGNIVIFDEAHNLEKICEDSTSFDLRSADLAAAIRELQMMSEKVMDMASSEDSNFDMGDSQVISEDFNIKDILELKGMLHGLEEAIDKIEIRDRSKGLTKQGRFVFELLGQVNLTFATKNRVVDLLDKIISYLTNEGSHSAFHSKGAGLSKIADMLKIVFSRDMDENSTLSFHERVISKHYKVHVSADSQNQYNNKKKAGSWDAAGSSSSKAGRTLSYWCFSPGHAMEELKANGVRCIILTSGTLSPLSSFKTEMGIDFRVELENPHVIEKHQVWVGTVSKGPDGTKLNSSYEHRFREDYQSSLGNAIVNFARTVPNGLLIFFPSYPVMEKCLENWQRRGIWGRIEQYKPVFIEPRNKSEFHTAMHRFYEKINDPALNGAIFAAVCRGKVSEGLDFSDINGRAVVITGLPFPPRMDPKVVHKMQYLDENKPLPGQPKGLTGQEWYRQQASRAVNQAVGRVIRHKQDYGAIILCDDRFASQASLAQLPSWLRPSVGKYVSFGNAIKDIISFFKHAEKTMPAPVFGKRGKQQRGFGDLGCQGASFEPSFSRAVPKGVERACSVSEHVPSLRTSRGIERDEVSLSRLRIQYESSQGSCAGSSKPKNFLDALSTSEKSEGGFDISDTQVPSFQSKITQDALKPKKKILIKERSSSPATVSTESSESAISLKKDQLHSAEKYLNEVKASLSTENYKLFSKTLAAYKKTSNFDAMVTTLADMFLDDEYRTQLFRRFYRFVRPQHKEKFNKTCVELTGQGCSSAEGTEDSTEKEVSPSGVNKRPKEQQDQRIESNKKRKFDSTESVKPGDQESQKRKIETSHNPKGSEVCGTSNQSESPGNRKSSSVKDNLPLQDVAPNQSETIAVTDSNNKNVGSKTDNELTLRKLHETAKENSLDEEENRDKQGPRSSENSGAAGDSSASNEKTASSAQLSNEEPDELTVPPDGMTDLQRFILGSRTNTKYTCGLCKKTAVLPLKASCQHVCCMTCWKTQIKDVGKCPTCDIRVKRKHLCRILL